MAKRKKKSTGNRKKALGVVLFLLAVLILISLISHHRPDDARIVGEIDSHLSPFDVKYHNQAGMLGAYLSYICLSLIGWLAFFIPLGLIFVSLRLFSSELATRFELNSFILFVISLLVTMIYDIHLLTERVLSVRIDIPGGYVAENLTQLSIKVVGDLGSYVVLSGIILILLILYTSVTPALAMRLRLPGGDIFRRAYTALARCVKSFFSLRWLAALFERGGGGEEDDEHDLSEDDTDTGLEAGDIFDTPQPDSEIEG
ncbi:MAG: DNA translocase FtsK 4TM domain-containing protein, partial [candidate division Zixibacteria bacterium]|nr:DNA translocase FtsK 4TM domain-containing protein [candidate division Zixibacteria bacterium]